MLLVLDRLLSKACNDMQLVVTVDDVSHGSLGLEAEPGHPSP